ncbi:DUF3309 family protein [Methylococcus mesophilus]|uniref:DUF3309 family protein n=1 Tax=Methylococcus mesophilus TaxID=2993564 RepID=UPI003743DE12
MFDCSGYRRPSASWSHVKGLGISYNAALLLSCFGFDFFLLWARPNFNWRNLARNFDSDALGVVPAWPHSRGCGYTPRGVIGLLLVIVLILF